MENHSAVWEGNKEKHLSKNLLLRLLMQKFNRDVVKTISRCNPKTVFDMGCGEGFTTRAIADAFPDARITAVDGEREYVDYALKHSRRPNISYAVGDLFALDAPDTYLYDCVIANEVLEHLEDVPRALERLTHLSKRFVLVSVPNEPWFRIGNFLRGKYVLAFGNTPGHINHWTRSGLRRLAEQYGTVVCLKTSTFWNIALFDPVRDAEHAVLQGDSASAESNKQEFSQRTKISNGVERRPVNESVVSSAPPSANRYSQAFFSKSFLHYLWTGGAITVAQVFLLWLFIDIMGIPTVASSIVVVGGLFLLRYLILLAFRVIK